MCDTLQMDVRASYDGKTVCLQVEHISGWTSNKKTEQPDGVQIDILASDTAMGPGTVEATLTQHPTISANTSEANNKGAASHKGYDKLR